MRNKYFVVYWTPVQMGNLIHVGGHPLLPVNYDKIVTGIAQKISLAGNFITKEAVAIVNVMEMPTEPLLEPEFIKPAPKKLYEEVAA